MTFDAFKGYVADVLARLVKVCIQKHMTSGRALGVMAWARSQRETIWNSFEAGEPIDDVAAALFNLSAKG